MFSQPEINETVRKDDSLDRNSYACLNSEPHGHNIRDHLSHYLGCLDYWERSTFFNADNALRNEEFEHFKSLGKTELEARSLRNDKLNQWKKDCDTELRRIDFLRRTLEGDGRDKPSCPGDRAECTSVEKVR